MLRVAECIETRPWSALWFSHVQDFEIQDESWIFLAAACRLRHGPRTNVSQARTRRAPALPQTRFPQKLRRFLGRRGIDIKTRAPFEPRDLGQLGHDLDVPVIIRHGG